MRTLLGTVLLCLLAWQANASYLEVRRSTNIYTDANSESEVIETVDPTDDEPLVILYLDEEDPREGNYLRVYAPSTGEIGYVYKTAGRVYPDHGGKYKPYKRSAYRHWIDEDRDCLDTRQEVLLRDDSSGQAKIRKSGSRCIVIDATWNDPYTGTIFNKAKLVDVDHLVPLKNAHESGAWAWSSERKKAYANYLGNAYYLLAVSASENRRKADKGPDQYLPPNEAYLCEYVANFLAVKHEWGLRVVPDEQVAADAVLADCPEP